jgi:hypothetical protein
MIAFRVQLNGEEPVTAGASGRDTVTVTAVSMIRDRRYRPEDEPPIHLKLNVGGLRRTAEGTQGYFEWVERQLTVGDEATIRVVDVDEADISRLKTESTMAKMTEDAERNELAYLIRKYGVP